MFQHKLRFTSNVTVQLSWSRGRWFEQINLLTTGMAAAAELPVKPLSSEILLNMAF
jgi:hypothetical protein